MGCGIYWQQRNVLSDSLNQLESWGVPDSDPGYQSLWSKLKEVLANIGRKLPRISINLKVTFGHSPGIFLLSVDPEIGFIVAAKERPGAPPIYRRVDNELARAIFLEELTEEQEKYLLTPDEYLGE